MRSAPRLWWCGAEEMPRNSSGNNSCLVGVCTSLVPESHEYARIPKRLRLSKMPDDDGTNESEN